MIKRIEAGDRMYPMAGWQIGPLPDHRVVLFQPHYLEDRDQPLTEAVADKIFILPVEQVPHLIEALKHAAADIPPPGAPKLRLVD